MINNERTKIGSKGEILIKKKFRMNSKIKSGDSVMIHSLPYELRIKKILSLEELKELPIISSGTVDEIEQDIMDEMEKQLEEDDN